MAHTATRSSRSPSKSRSRSSEKLLNSSSRQRLDSLFDISNCRAPPTFNVAESSPNLSFRRASAIQLTSSSSRSPRSSSRSRSLRNKRSSNYSGGIRQSPSGSNLDPSNQHRSSISHSLSVPSGDEDFHLVRNFSVTSKGVINRGDSFRSKSSRSTSLCSTPTSPDGEGSSSSSFPELVEATVTEIAASSSQVQPNSSVQSSVGEAAPPPTTPKYKVWLMGSNGVGKSALKNQFMTSEYICQYESWNDENPNQSVSVSLDGEETEVELVECPVIEDKGRLKDCSPDAYIIVYSVTNRRSYIQARQILSRLETFFGTKAAILVANKTDLARLRTVSTVEGRSLAKERGCKFIETSVAINHQVDELLVGIITQIRIKAKIAEKQKKTSGRNSQNPRSKATCIIKRLWRKTCLTSKSCDNLHAL